jgi:hypothetical protein
LLLDVSFGKTKEIQTGMIAVLHLGQNLSHHPTTTSYLSGGVDKIAIGRI